MALLLWKCFVFVWRRCSCCYRFYWSQEDKLASIMTQPTQQERKGTFCVSQHREAVWSVLPFISPERWMNIYVNEKKIHVKMARNYLKVTAFFSGLPTCQHVDMVKCRMYVWQNKVDQNNVAPQDVLNKLLINY